MNSIRRSLTWSLLLGLIGLVAVSDFALYRYVSSRSIAQFDRGLRDKARTFAGLIEQGDHGIEVELREHFLPEYERKEQPEYYQVWMRDGKVIERSSTLAENDLPMRSGSLDAPIIWNLPLPDGRKGRAVGVSFVPEQDHEEEEEEEEEDNTDAEIEKRTNTSPIPVVIVLARDTNELNKTLSSFVLGTFISGFLTCVCIALLISRLVKSGLQPLNELAKCVSAVDSHSLDTRFQADDLPRELKPIAKRLNGLLQRLELAFVREKRLTADIAHELKTPLAELRSLSEVFLKWPDDKEFLQETLTDVIDISNNMNNMVSTLLALARCEAGSQSLCTESLDIGNLTRTLWKEWGPQASEKKIDIHFDIEKSTKVETDTTALSSILTNLFSNAVDYCPNAGHIACTLKDQNNSTNITITNTTDTLTEEDLPHLFEPLWRKDPARSSDSHSGLGLALTKSLANILKITIHANLIENHQIQISLNIPHAIKNA